MAKLREKLAIQNTESVSKEPTVHVDEQTEDDEDAIPEPDSDEIEGSTAADSEDDVRMDDG